MTAMIISRLDNITENTRKIYKLVHHYHILNVICYNTYLTRFMVSQFTYRILNDIDYSFTRYSYIVTRITRTDNLLSLKWDFIYTLIPI